MFNKKIDDLNYSKDRNVCIICYNKNRRENNINETLIQNQQPKTDINKEDDKNNNKKKEKLLTL